MSKYAQKQSNKKSKSECKICYNMKKIKKLCTTCKHKSFCTSCFEKESKRKFDFRYSDSSFVSYCPVCRSHIKIPPAVLNKMKRELFTFLASVVKNLKVFFLK